MYNVDYFINLVNNIPEENLIEHHFGNGTVGCINGHLGVRSAFVPNEASAALKDVFSGLELTCKEPMFHPDTHKRLNSVEEGDALFPGYSVKAALINNGKIIEYQQSTPKQRLLAALEDIKLMELVELN